jgi:Na+-transporting NADH:ubiquinone oxidoreductase subunit C
VIKGVVSEGTENAQYKIDGLSGATITSNGVEQLVRYWVGPDAFGPFLEKLR